jgi:hypothetical protein
MWSIIFARQSALHTVPHVVRETDTIIATYFPRLDERARSTVELLVDVVVDVLPDAEHARKWGRLTFTRHGDWHHWLCAVAAGKKSVKLVVHKGALLADPLGVLEGEGRYLRALTFASPEDVDAEVVASILREAAARQTDM